ncbi:MAG: metallo-beta-lactamase family protein [Gammaproteobacteria bacterium]
MDGFKPGLLRYRSLGSSFQASTQNEPMTRLSFHGGAGTVTGSKHLVEHGNASILVDCGMFQGRRELRERNWRPLAFSPAGLDAVLLTHAHIDHSGYLPRLVKDGFKGRIYCTQATAELVELLLRDSAMIQEEDAEHANRRGYSRHKPALPLYSVEEAVKALGHLHAVDYDEWLEPAHGVRFQFFRAGHILGSGMVQMECEREGEEPLRLLLTGDIGRYDAPLVPDPSPPPPTDILVVESTYGDRTHTKVPVEAQIESVLEKIKESEGQALIPSFAVGRAQQLLLLLHNVMERRPELAFPVHLDSPMAVNTTKLYQRYPEERGLEAVDIKSGSSKIYGDRVYLHRTREESMRLNDLRGPRVIVSSSGMLSGGRVLHHLRRILPSKRNVVVLAGYQAPGTRGWRLQQNERRIRVHGRDVEVQASVSSISGLSAHADSDQILHWAKDLAPPRRTFVIHGEPHSARALAARLESELNFPCETPELGDGFEL